MYYKSSKKMIILNIISILYRYTDEVHTITQKQISDILESEYEMKCDRKSITRNIRDLIDYLDGESYEIGYDITTRQIPVINQETKESRFEEQEIYTNFYLKRPFTDGELRLLIDAIMFSMNISSNHRNDLIEKICDLSNRNFKARVRYIANASTDRNLNQQIFRSIDLLDEAIEKNLKIKFKYAEFGTDKKLHNKKAVDGTDRIYVVSPYQMAAKEGKYYLICNYDKYDDISNYRIDRIKDIELLNDMAKPFSSLKWSDGRILDLKTYMKEHIYMYSSKNVRVTFKINKPMISDIIDTFGSEVRFKDETKDSVTVITTVNEDAMIQFAKRFAPDVVVIEPKELRDKVVIELENALRIYERK